jgi:hypothetical protein
LTNVQILKNSFKKENKQQKTKRNEKEKNELPDVGPRPS